MAEQWIEASTARDLVGSTHALCSRLHAGLVLARARLLTVDDKSLESGTVPSKFWWAEGHEALDQNWESGDFSTWIDSQKHWKAFGVTFALSGILEMLPVEQRGKTAYSLSIASNPEWLSASAARRLSYQQGGENPAIAGRAIVAQAKLGFVTARAVLAQGSKSNIHGAPWIWEAREWDIAPWFWESFTDTSSSSQSWDIGMFSGRGIAPNGLTNIRLTGVHFLRASLDVLFPPPVAPTPVVPIAKDVGGRLPAAFADELMCAIWGQIHRGFQPKTKADVQRAMQDWASENGHELGVTSAKEKARKVFSAYME